MTKDNVIVFPTDRIKNKDKVLIDKEEIKKQYNKIEEQQSKAFVETAVDDLALILCKYLFLKMISILLTISFDYLSVNFIIC